MSHAPIGAGAELWIVVGPNGAGKSTIIQSRHLRHRLEHAHRLNADDRTRELLAEEGLDFSAPPQKLEQTFIRAANETFAETIALLTQGRAVCVETVLSTDKYRDLVESVLAAGAFFGLIYVALNCPELSWERVQIRAGLGGHGVPADKLRARWYRSIEKLDWYARKAHFFVAYDNSHPVHEGSLPGPFATGEHGRIIVHDPDAIPEISKLFQR
jgi:predicted ABC-type ATPase